MIIVLILSIIGPISALYECDDGKEIITDVNLRCNGNIDCDDGLGDHFFYSQISEVKKIPPRNTAKMVNSVKDLTKSFVCNAR